MKNPSSLTAFQISFISAALLSACSPTSGGSAPGVQNSHIAGSQVSCQNPIVVDDNGGDFSQLKGKFKLQSQQLYVVSTPRNDSFLASANESNGFAVNLDCAGVSDAGAKNFDHAWTDADGSSHERSENHSSSLNGSFTAGEIADLSKFSFSPTQRKISVSFKNGHLENATTELSPTEKTTESLKVVPKGPIELGNGMTFKINANALDSSTFELKIKINSHDEDGNSIEEYGRAVFVKAK